MESEGARCAYRKMAGAKRNVRSAAVALVCTLLAGKAVAGSPTFDIHTQSPLSEGSDSAGYLLSVSDCTSILGVTAGGNVMTPAESIRDASHPNACSFPFTADGNAVFQPSVDVAFLDGNSQTYSETLSYESHSPDVSIAEIGVAADDGGQFATLTLTASDDTDISYVSVELTGLRASDLRRFGGVVEKAANSAFVETNGFVRKRPITDDQTDFHFLAPFQETLSGEEMARNALLLIEATVVDASGNQASLSEVRYLGESVSESVNGLYVAPESLVFSDALQFARLLPSLDYEFRGLTPAPGAGTGVTYTSSEPSVVAVTSDGLVYPLKETAADVVAIEVAYPGQPPVPVPVTVDYSRNLTGLRYQGQESGPFNLSRLNATLPLPELSAVFDDGSTAPLNDSLELAYELPSASEGIINVSAQGQLRASAIIPQEAPVVLRASLKRDPGIYVDIPVTATDAPPEIDIDVPSQASVGTELNLTPQATDDVAIQMVEFWLEGNLLGRSAHSPYQLSFPL